MSLLSSLTPQPLWSYFEELTRIPRESKNEAAAVAWLVEQGREIGCEVEMRLIAPATGIGNVLFRKPATPGHEDRPGIILQAHIDMVCVKTPNSAHDFTRDPLSLRFVGEKLFATDTTLGADNGIGVAAALAVLASRDLVHGPLEVLITVDEETGMTGAFRLDENWLRGQYLLNLDSEEDGCLTIGCAGGLDTVVQRRFTALPAPAGKKAHLLKLSKLQGGHSGMQIDKGRFNAIRVLVEVLHPLMGEYGLQLAAFDGGEKRNAIPGEAGVVVWVDPAQEAKLLHHVAQEEAKWRAYLGPKEKDFSLTMSPTEADFCLPEADAAALVGLLLALPHGVEQMSAEVPGFVEASVNLAIVHSDQHQADVQIMSRGSSEMDVASLRQRIEAIAHLAGFATAHGNGYPGWKPLAGTAMERLLNATHEEIFGKPMHVSAVHAGLECGIIGSKYPGMQMISFGPTIEGAHTPEENVAVSSVTSFWKLLVAALGKV